MRVIAPRFAIVALLLGTQSTPTEAKCFFGTFKCGDGQAICLNPITVGKCAFDAVCPIKLDAIIITLGNALKALTPDQLDFVIDLGVGEINSVFDDFRDCFKGFEGTVPQCQQLHTVHSCVSAALDAATALKGAGKFAKLAAGKLDKANKALNIIEGNIIPALNKEGGSGCLNEDTCPAPSTTTTTTTVTTTTTTTGCDDASTASSATTDSTDSTAITLEYKAPSGCTSRARNVAYFMDDQTPPLLVSKAYFPEMGCFVGKQQNGCTASYKLQDGDISLSGEMQWSLNDLQFQYFIPCVDQYGRKYSERTQKVELPTATTAAPAACTETNTTTTTTTSASSKSAAPSLQGVSRTIAAIVMASATWWLIA